MASTTTRAGIFRRLESAPRPWSPRKRLLLLRLAEWPGVTGERPRSVRRGSCAGRAFHHLNATAFDDARKLERSGAPRRRHRGGRSRAAACGRGRGSILALASASGDRVGRPTTVPDSDGRGNPLEGMPPRLTLERIETISVLGTFSLVLAGAILAARQRTQAKREERASQSAGPNREVAVVQEVGEQPGMAAPAPSSFALVQFQVAGLCTALACNLLNRGRKSAGDSQPFGSESHWRGGGLEEGSSRSDSTVASAAEAEARSSVHKSIFRLNRQLSKTTVKQRVARRALEQQMDSMAKKNLATNEALVQYSKVWGHLLSPRSHQFLRPTRPIIPITHSLAFVGFPRKKEFKKLQSEVGQVYSIVSELEGAMRAQLKLIRQLAEAKSDEGRGGGAAEAVSENGASSPRNTFAAAIAERLKGSSTFTHAVAREPTTGISNGVREERNVEVTRDGHIYHFKE